MRYVVLAIALLATALVGKSFASSIAVLNPSFEDGIDNSNPPTNWLGAGIFRESASVGLTAGTTGSYVGQVNAGNSASAFGYGYQSLGQTFVAGTTYTLTADVGMRNDKIGTDWYADSVDWSMQINAAGVATLDTLSGTILNDAGHTGFLTPETLQYIATAADAGNVIQIEFNASTVGKTSPNPSDGVYGFISYDNVQVSSAVPEPGSLTLLGAGLTALLAYAWRKRK